MYNEGGQPRNYQGIGIGKAQVVRTADTGINYSEIPKLKKEEELRKQDREDAAAAAEQKRRDSLKGVPKFDVGGIPPSATKVVNDIVAKNTDTMIEQFQKSLETGDMNQAQLENFNRKVMQESVAMIEDLKTIQKTNVDISKNPENYTPETIEMFKQAMDEDYVNKRAKEEGWSQADIGAFYQNVVNNMELEEDIDMFYETPPIFQGSSTIERRNADNTVTGTTSVAFDEADAKVWVEGLENKMSSRQKQRIEQEHKGGLDGWRQDRINDARGMVKTNYKKTQKGSPKSGSGRSVADSVSITSGVEIPTPTSSDSEGVNVGGKGVKFEFGKTDGRTNPEMSFRMSKNSDEKVVGTPKSIIYDPTGRKSMLEVEIIKKVKKKRSFDPNTRTWSEGGEDKKVETLYLPVDELNNTGGLTQEYKDQVDLIKENINKIEADNDGLKLSTPSKSDPVTDKIFN